MEDDPYVRLLKKASQFIELPTSSISKASELGEEINEAAIGLRDAVKLKPTAQRKLDRLIAKLGGLSSRLSRSASNSRRGAFRRDWARFARSETTGLKDEVLALREFLILNEKAIGSALGRTERGFSLPELIGALREEDAIHEVTYARLTKRIAEMGRRELQKRERGVGENLIRISGWLSDLREIRQVGENVSKKEG